MNYKKRNIIGIISFIIIILIMVNLNFFLQVLNHNVLNIKFIGIKNNELFLSELSDTLLTKNDLINYINGNIEQIGRKKLENFDFAVYVRNVEEQDNFLEKFRIPIDDNFNDSLHKGLDLIPNNQDLLLRFVLYSEKKSYTSGIFDIKVVDEVYKNEGRMVLELSDFSGEGVTGFVGVPKYLKLKSGSRIDITAKHGDLDVKDLAVSFDESSLKLSINNLVPLKEYSHIEIYTRNNEGIDVVIKLKNILIQPETKLQEYLSRVYLISMGRYPYENEYMEALNNLQGHKVSINKFISEIISSQEFININDTPKKIIDSIYYLVNKKNIDVRVSALVLDEFNQLLLNDETQEDAKRNVLNKFLYSEDSLNYMETQLNVRVD